MRSIKTKILLIYVFLIFLIFFGAVVSIYNLYSVNKSVDGLIAANYRSIVAARNMLEAIERQDSYELTYIQVENENSIRSFYENQKEFITWLGKARDNITESRENQVIEDISNNYMKYSEYFSKLQQIKNTSGINNAGVFYNNEIYPVFLSVKNASRELLEINETAMFNSKEKVKNNSERLIYITAFLSFLSILAGLAVAIFYTRKIVNPVQKLISGAKSIKEGNLNHEIEISTRDEIGELALEFNNMTRRLRLYEKSNIRNQIAEKNKSLAIVKSISDPIIVTDNNYKIILLNKSAESVFSIWEKEAVNHHFLENIKNEIIFSKIKTAMTRSSGEDYDKIIKLDAGGKTRYYIITATPVYYDENEVAGVVTVLRDITGIKEIERMKSDFVATISHELRTPLTSVIMGTGLLLDNVSGPLNEDQKEILEAMGEDSNQLLSIINDLLDLSRIESGKLHMNYESVSMAGIIETSAKSFTDIAENKGVTLTYLISEKIPFIKADANKLTSVLNNLISNALKFTKSGDQINISAELTDNYIKVTVADSGIGIPEEYQEAIFEKFVQIDQIADDRKSSGLGLAISKEFIKKHGGDIWVESKPGSGSSFIFTVPV